MKILELITLNVYKICLGCFLLLFIINSVCAFDVNDTQVLNNDSSVVQDNSIQTFDDLQNVISAQNTSEINLNGNYKYSVNDSLVDGVVISKNITIKGNNCVIDANNIARCFYITSNTHVSLENIVFINGYSNSSDGGAIHTDKFVNLTIINCVFKNNLIYNHNGGAMSTNESCNIEIYNSVFENNTSIRQSNMAWADFKEGMGSALYHTINSTLTLIDSKFLSNNAYLSIILLVSYDDVNYALSKLYVKNCLFTNNTSFRCGVLYIDEFGEGEIIDSVFTDNHSQVSTGTLILDTCPYALVKNCLFKDNTGVEGAAICVEIYKGIASHAQIIDCKFINNFASHNGGAISSKGGIVNVQNCLFNQNGAFERGGAIFSKNGRLIMANSKATNNYATYGGSIYLNSNDSSLINIDFLNNHASNKGGAVYLKEYACLDNCIYLKNSAPNDKNKYNVYNAYKINGVISLNKIKTSFKSGKLFKITLKDSKTKKAIIGVKLKIKIYTKKKYKTIYVKTNDKGIAYFDASSFDVGKHKMVISSSEGCVSVKKTKTIKITKSKSIVTIPKKIRFKSKIKIQIKHKTTKNPISNVKIKIKINNKVFIKKTNNKGAINLNTKSLKKGKYVVKISSTNQNIKVSKKSKIKIK